MNFLIESVKHNLSSWCSTLVGECLGGFMVEVLELAVALKSAIFMLSMYGHHTCNKHDNNAALILTRSSLLV